MFPTPQGIVAVFISILITTYRHALRAFILSIVHASGPPEPRPLHLPGAPLCCLGHVCHPQPTAPAPPPQELPSGAPDMFVTLNPLHPPAADKVIRRLSLAHPVFRSVGGEGAGKGNSYTGDREEGGTCVSIQEKRGRELLCTSFSPLCSPTSPPTPCFFPSLIQLRLRGGPGQAPRAAGAPRHVLCRGVVRVRFPRGWHQGGGCSRQGDGRNHTLGSQVGVGGEERGSRGGGTRGKWEQKGEQEGYQQQGLGLGSGCAGETYRTTAIHRPRLPPTAPTAPHFLFPGPFPPR